MLLLILWIFWCCLHSLLIATPVRHWFEKKGGVWLGLYRLGYVCFSAATLLPLLWYTSIEPPQLIFTVPHWLHGVQFLLLCYALTMFIGGLRVYNLGTFLGTRQWREYRSGHVNVSPAFVQTGILRFVRHPWYSGGIALLWALPALTDVSLKIRLLLTCYLLIGTLLEERKLKASLGQPYLDYCRQVPILFPWNFRR